MVCVAESSSRLCPEHFLRNDGILRYHSKYQTVADQTFPAKSRVKPTGRILGVFGKDIDSEKSFLSPKNPNAETHGNSYR